MKVNVFRSRWIRLVGAAFVVISPVGCGDGADRPADSAFRATDSRGPMPIALDSCRGLWDEMRKVRESAPALVQSREGFPRERLLSDAVTAIESLGFDADSTVRSIVLSARHIDLTSACRDLALLYPVDPKAAHARGLISKRTMEFVHLMETHGTEETVAGRSLLEAVSRCERSLGSGCPLLEVASFHGDAGTPRFNWMGRSLDEILASKNVTELRLFAEFVLGCGDVAAIAQLRDEKGQIPKCKEWGLETVLSLNPDAIEARNQALRDMDSERSALGVSL